MGEPSSFLKSAEAPINTPWQGTRIEGSPVGHGLPFGAVVVVAGVVVTGAALVVGLAVVVVGLAVGAVVVVSSTLVVGLALVVVVGLAVVGGATTDVGVGKVGVDASATVKLVRPRPKGSPLPVVVLAQALAV